ncbi:MAG: cytochrome c [Actinobacteria bacterium]|nr:cytochrome c [Actinomycetota bacterium]
MRRRWLVLAIGCLLLLVAAGCGGGETASPTPETVEGTVPTETEGGGAGGPEGDATAGKEIFTSAGCGSCHTFEKAGSSGQVGPDLDESKTPYDEAVEQIANGGGAMPPFKDQLSEKQIADVAAFVSASESG